jgi:hypothetical protein
MTVVDFAAHGEAMPGSVVNVTSNVLAFAAAAGASYLVNNAPSGHAAVLVARNRLSFGALTTHMTAVRHLFAAEASAQPPANFAIDANVFDCTNGSFSSTYALWAGAFLGTGSQLSITRNVLGRHCRSPSGYASFGSHGQQLTNSSVAVDFSDNVIAEASPESALLLVPYPSPAVGANSTWTVMRNRFVTWPGRAGSCPSDVVALPSASGDSQISFANNVISLECHQQWRAVTAVSMGYRYASTPPGGFDSFAAVNVSGNAISIVSQAGYSISGLVIFSRNIHLVLRGNTLRLHGTTPSNNVVYVQGPWPRTAGPSAASFIIDGNDVLYTAVSRESYDSENSLIRFDTSIARSVVVTNNRLNYTGPGRSPTSRLSVTNTNSMLSVQCLADTVNVSGNNFAARLTNSSGLRDAIRVFYRRDVFFAASRVFVAEDNVATLTNATGGRAGYSAFLNAGPAEERFDSNVTLARNVVDASMFFNATALATNSSSNGTNRTVTSRCDVNNGLPVDEIIDGTVLSCGPEPTTTTTTMTTTTTTTTTTSTTAQPTATTNTGVPATTTTTTTTTEIPEATTTTSAAPTTTTSAGPATTASAATVSPTTLTGTPPSTTVTTEVPTATTTVLPIPSALTTPATETTTASATATAATTTTTLPPPPSITAVPNSTTAVAVTTAVPNATAASPTAESPTTTTTTTTPAATTTYLPTTSMPTAAVTTTDAPSATTTAAPPAPAPALVRFEVNASAQGGAFNPEAFAAALAQELGLPAGSVTVESQSGAGSTTQGEVTVRFADPAQAALALDMTPAERGSLGITGMSAAGDAGPPASRGDGDDDDSTVYIVVGVVAGVVVLGGIAAFVVVSKAKSAASRAALDDASTNFHQEQPMLPQPEKGAPYHTSNDDDFGDLL